MIESTIIIISIVNIQLEEKRRVWMRYIVRNIYIKKCQMRTA